jgi:hypothetical protein
MKSETFDRILEGVPGSKRESGALLVPEDSEVTLYVVLATEVLQVARVARVERPRELEADTLAVETHGGERYYVSVDAVAMLKVHQPGKKGAVRGAGFR